MNKNRDPKTGRFIAKAKMVKATTKTSKAAPAPMKVTFKLLVNDLQVFGKKSMEGKPSSIKTGTEVVLKEMPDGNVRVKKAESSRTFYTTKERLETCI